MKVDILGVKIDQFNMQQAVDQVQQWLSKPGKHYIVTPNIEFIMAAQKDSKFKRVLNKADMSIPDSSRFGWATDQLKEKNLILKYIKWPLFLLPKFPLLRRFDVVAGTDMMEELIKVSVEKSFTIGLLGGRDGVALKLKERLLERYPKLKITFASDGGIIDRDGNPVESIKYQVSSIKQKKHNIYYLIPNTDLLFVAFGHIKQEKWIDKNLDQYPVKVMMGVGGAFDYLSGDVSRAPALIRFLGFEWLFRLLIQPWRIKRFGKLIKFVFLISNNRQS